MTRARKRRSPRGRGAGFEQSTRHGPLDFSPPAAAIKLVRCGFICAAWHRRRADVRYYFVDHLPVLMTDPLVDFLLAPAQAYRLAAVQHRKPGTQMAPIAAPLLERLCLQKVQDDVVLQVNLGGRRVSAC